MSCEHCEQTVAEALQDVSGVTDVSVDREAEQVNVDGDADVSAIVEAVEDAVHCTRLRRSREIRVTDQSSVFPGRLSS